jgi:hypothetical protein
MFATKLFFAVYPFINDMETLPAASRHKISLSPSPLKSVFVWRGMTLYVAALLVPLEVETVTARASGTAIEATESVAVAEVALVTRTSLTVSPLPAFTVRLESNAVPVSVTGILVPCTPIAGVIEFNVEHERHPGACPVTPGAGVVVGVVEARTGEVEPPPRSIIYTSLYSVG